MNRKSAWIVFALTLLITLPTRLYQILFLMDKKTGFYTDGNTTTAIISIGFVIGILLMVALSTMDRHESKGYHPIHSTPAAVIGALTGLGLVIESTVSLLDRSNSQNHFMYMILSVVGILTGAVLILTAYDFAVGENHLSKYPLLALVPPIWGCFCLVTLFITYVAVVNVSENIYDTFTVIFLLLFFFAQAKMFAGVENQKSSRLIYIFGLPAILLSLVTGIPGMVSFFSGTSQTGYFPIGLYFVAVLMALYLFVFLAAVHRMQNTYSQYPEEQIEPQNPLLDCEAGTDESETQTPELFEKKNCFEFLSKAYQSEEKFMERVQSPFYNSKN